MGNRAYRYVFAPLFMHEQSGCRARKVGRGGSGYWTDVSMMLLAVMQITV